MIKKLFFLILFIFKLECTIRIVCTAALLNDRFEMRKEEYIKSLQQLKKFGYKNVYIVEAINQKGPTFLNNYCNNVFYSKAHDFNIKDIRNKGINEARTLFDCLSHYNFDDEDIIVKLTGRYFLKSDHFLKIVEANPNIDAFIKIIDIGFKWPIAGCFGLRCKFLKDMIKKLDYKMMEEKNIYIETCLLEYINKMIEMNQIKAKFIDNLDISINCMGDGSYWQAEY